MSDSTFAIAPIDPEKDAEDYMRAQLSGFGDSCAIVNTFYPIAVFPNFEREIVQHAVERIQGGSKQHAPGWMKVIDTATGKMASCVHWTFHTTNPYESKSASNSSPSNDFWLPDQPPMSSRVRELLDVIIAESSAYRAPMRPRPHAWINIAFTERSQQRKGLAGRLLEWGIKKADALGLETHVEASPQGRELYSKYGFIQVATCHIDPRRDDDEDWNDICRRLRYPQFIYLMWRPVGGIYQPGVTKTPWKGGPKPEEHWTALFED